MSTKNTESGVRHVIKASKVEIGMAPAEADAWANANLEEGVARFRTEFGKHRGDPEEGAHEGFQAVKVWAQS
jgi:hypothetical protein